jgi:hypothetical protein
MYWFNAIKRKATVDCFRGGTWLPFGGCWGPDRLATEQQHPCRPQGWSNHLKGSCSRALHTAPRSWHFTNSQLKSFSTILGSCLGAAVTVIPRVAAVLGRVTGVGEISEVSFGVFAECLFVLFIYNNNFPFLFCWIIFQRPRPSVCKNINLVI